MRGLLMKNNNPTPAPIALFVYSRLGHAQRTINALKRNLLASDTELFIFSDGPKTKEKIPEVNAVRKYLRSVKGFKSVKIFESRKNKGLAASITYGVTKIVNKYGRVIVVEDDIFTSPYFLTFMNNALNYYENDSRVISISGYTYPIKDLPETFFLKNAECWGWGTWKRGWDLFESDGKKLLLALEKRNLASEFDFNNSYDYTQMLKDQIAKKNNSWAIRWYASAFLKDKLTLYPRVSLAQNIGVDGTGTHGGLVNVYSVNLSKRNISVGKIPVIESREARKKFELFFRKIRSRYYRVFVFAKNYIKRALLPQ
ncbi:Uncharacterised protein [uncultured archaeon]|nr:Uncharacterised protein [uncultured archaeon]